MNFLRCFLLLLLFSGCATSRPHTASEGIQDANPNTDRHFFFDGWWPQRSTPEDREDRQYFYNSLLGKQ